MVGRIHLGDFQYSLFRLVQYVRLIPILLQAVGVIHLVAFYGNRIGFVRNLILAAFWHTGFFQRIFAGRNPLEQHQAIRAGNRGVNLAAVGLIRQLEGNAGQKFLRIFTGSHALFPERRIAHSVGAGGVIHCQGFPFLQGFAACGDGAVLVQGHLNGFPAAGKAVRRLSFFQIIGSIAQIGELHSAGAIQQLARPGFLAAVNVLGHLGALRVGIQGKLSAAVNRLLLAVEHKGILGHSQAIPLDGQGLFHNQFYRRGFVLHVADLNLGAGILHHRILRQRLIAYLGLVIQNRPDKGNVGGNLISGRVKLHRHLIGGGQQRAIRYPNLSLGHHGLVEFIHILKGQAL